jgi:ABC-type multidrug transport system ATPase subunit
VTFSVRRGELFALLGTNGAGKTSTMELLEGLAPAAQGAVRVLGCDPYRERALVRRLMGSCRHRTWQLIRELLVARTTVLLTTHYLGCR